MATATPKTAQPQESPSPIPPLQNGDHLTREEFERRYEAMPDVKAELIEGVVYMASPVNHENHGKPHGKVMFWLGSYVASTPGIDFADNSTLKLDDANEPQPDALLYILPDHGGQARTDAEGYFTAAPEWTGEVAASSVSNDLHKKLYLYRRHGVKEYVVWRVLDRVIDWFVLRGDRYDRLPLSVDGYFKSEVFPGLWLDPAALVAQDLTKILQVVQLGLASPEHRQFVERLARRQQEIAQGRSA